MKRKMLFALVIAVMLTSITAIFVSAENEFKEWGLRPPPIDNLPSTASAERWGYSNEAVIYINLAGTAYEQLFGSYALYNNITFVKEQTGFSTSYSFISENVWDIGLGDAHPSIRFVQLFDNPIGTYGQLELISADDGSVQIVVPLGYDSESIPPENVTLRLLVGYDNGPIFADSDYAYQMELNTYENYPIAYSWLHTFFDFRVEAEYPAYSIIDFYKKLTHTSFQSFGEAWCDWTYLTSTFAVFFGIFTVTLLGAWLTNFIKRR